MPTSTNVDDFDYELPRELIAQRPLRSRADARLLVVDRDSGNFQHLHVRDLPELLGPADALVLNDTKVLPARLVGRRTTTNGKWNGLFLGANNEGCWRVLSQTRGKLVPGETITLQNRQSVAHCEMTMVMQLEGGVWLARPPAGADVELLEIVGRVPLPPYIRGGEMVDTDEDDYQTVFARTPGAIAAPTAGLHFTDSLLQQMGRRGVTIHRLTLHVGVGTFRPISTPQIEDHPMHSEWASLSGDVARRLRASRERGGRIVAVGTTVVRTLETAGRSGEIAAWSGETNLYIHPPYHFRATDAVLTNFHVPKSTLLVLVRTFGGDELIRAAYEEAIREQYRFFSYGDAMLIL